MEIPLEKGDQRPKAWRVLCDAIETARRSDHLLGFLSEGIRACISNAESLAMDLSVLVNNKRIAAAQFVYATCMEEMGKALILLDLVRADFRQDKDERLKLLCKAFSNHLKKYGYAKTICSPGTGRLKDALYLYKLEVVEYWPNTDPADGQPDSTLRGVTCHPTPGAQRRTAAARYRYCQVTIAGGGFGVREGATAYQRSTADSGGTPVPSTPTHLCPMGGVPLVEARSVPNIFRWSNCFSIGCELLIATICRSEVLPWD